MSSSKRTANTTNNTEITDSRVVGGDASINLSANDSTVRLSMTDHGAVTGGLALGGEAITAAVKLADNTNATAGNMFAGALDAIENANDRLSLAYQSGQAGEQVGLKYAGFIVVGLGVLAFAASRK